MARLLLAGLGFLAGSMSAQQPQLSISGTVQDDTGVIPGAEVTLRDSVGGTSTTTSDGSGHYQFESLKAGRY
jgi:hypothetical protein